ncbi:MAG TPA: lysoplasmalogenase [Ilumatobacter sp.]|nr:lysoplasmalogenase [Ilumatobacter sp.]
MNDVAMVALIAAAVIAPINWWSSWANASRARRATKPVVTALIIVAAATLDGDHLAVRLLVIAGLTFSLAGDVALMLPSDQFIAGLAAFFVAHLIYIAATLVSPDFEALGVPIAAAGVMTVLLTVGRRIMRSVASQPMALQRAVGAYMLVISAMLAVAIIAGPVWMAVGAAVFVASDAMLGWNRFVRPSRVFSPLVMASYHIGQALITWSLVTQ